MTAWDAYESFTIFLAVIVLSVVHRKITSGIDGPIIELGFSFAAWLALGAVVAWIIEGGFE